MVRFGDVVSNVNENTRDPRSLGLDRVVGLDHLDPESLPLRRWDLLEEMPDGTSFTRTFKAGQVLFGKRRAYQRKVAVPDFSGICSGDILVFESSTEDLLQAFLPYVVQSAGFFDHALGTSAGSLSPRTKWQELAKYEFALPPIDEQERIAEVMAAIDETGNACLHVANSAFRTSQAITRAALEGPGIEVVRLEELAEIQYGLTLNATRRELPMQLDYLRVANVHRDRLDLSEIKKVGATERDVEKYSLHQGDILVVEGHASSAEVGRAAGWDGPPQGCPSMLHQNHVLRVRCRSKLDADYALAAINSHMGQQYFLSRAKSTSGLNTINSNVLKAFPMPMIELPAQKRIAEELQGSKRVVLAAEESLKHSRSLRIELLRTLLGGSSVR